MFSLDKSARFKIFSALNNGGVCSLKLLFVIILTTFLFSIYIKLIQMTWVSEGQDRITIVKMWINVSVI